MIVDTVGFRAGGYQRASGTWGTSVGGSSKTTQCFQPSLQGPTTWKTGEIIAFKLRKENQIPGAHVTTQGVVCH